MNGKKTLIFGIILTSAVILLLFKFYGYEKTWRLWNIRTMTPHFADLRTITGGVDSIQKGYDPLYVNPCDPWNRALNYPRIWLSLKYIGLTQKYTTHLGIIFILLFFSGIVLAFKKIRKIDSFILLFLIFSPAVLLGIERANADLFIFFLTSLVLCGSSPYFSSGVLLFASILKLYPIIGIFYFLKEKRGTFLKIFIVISALFFIYAGFVFEDIIQILKTTPKAYKNVSYGLHVFAMRISQASNPDIGNMLRYAAYVLVLIVIGISFYVTLRNLEERTAINYDHIDHFRLGSFLFSGTFMIGTNFDYKLMFLLYAIPQLTLWLREKQKHIRISAYLALAGIIVSCWYLFFSRYIPFLPHGYQFMPLIDECASWMVFITMTFFIIYTLPPWCVYPFVKTKRFVAGAIPA